MKGPQLTTHAVDAVELSGKQVAVGLLVHGRRGGNEGFDRRRVGSPILVQDTVLDSGSRVRAVLGRGNTTIHLN